MKWIINDEVYTDAREAADYIMDNASEDYYDAMLDDCCEEVTICGYTYCASLALYRVDPIAYQCGRTDWEDAEATNIAYELDRMDNGEMVDFYDYAVECVDDSEE